MERWWEQRRRADGRAKLTPRIWPVVLLKTVAGPFVSQGRPQCSRRRPGIGGARSKPARDGSQKQERAHTHRRRPRYPVVDRAIDHRCRRICWIIQHSDAKLLIVHTLLHPVFELEWLAAGLKLDDRQGHG